MNLEAGKYYKQRDGRRAFVAILDPNRKSVHQALGWDADGDGCAWDMNGYFSEVGACNYDLVVEWPSEVTITSETFEEAARNAASEVPRSQWGKGRYTAALKRHLGLGGE